MNEIPVVFVQCCQFYSLKNSDGVIVARISRVATVIFSYSLHCKLLFLLHKSRSLILNYMINGFFYTWCLWENVKCMWICPSPQGNGAGCLCLMELVCICYCSVECGLRAAGILLLFFSFWVLFEYSFDVFGWEFFPFLPIFEYQIIHVFQVWININLYERFCILTLPLFNLVILFFFWCPLFVYHYI